MNYAVALKKRLIGHQIDLWIIIGLLVLAGLPRLLDLGTFLTADEKNWIGRSYEFIRAFKDFRFNDMLQTTHPGVTTLWLSGLAVTAKMYLSQVPFSFRNLSHFVATAQLPIALANSVMVSVFYILLNKIFGGRRWLAGLAAAAIALDPILIGYSRVAHVDALLASLMFASAMMAVIYAQKTSHRYWLAGSAIFGGLAILTKAPAVFLWPWLILVFLFFEGKSLLNKEVLVDRVRDALLWTLLAGLVFIWLWPAIMWVPNPEGNVLLLKRDISTAALTPHHMSEKYTVNASYYLITLITRVSPFVQVSAIGVVVWLIFMTLKPKIPNPHDLMIKRIGWLLIGYVFFFVLMMTLGAKKGDRYVLPVFPALDVLAIVGLYGVASVFKTKSQIQMTSLCSSFRHGLWSHSAKGFGDGARAQRGYGWQATDQLTAKSQVGQRVFVVSAVILLVSLGVITWGYHPYEIAYSNPLLPNNLSEEVGWGEGLDKVAVWLNQNDPKAVVASWYPEELGAFTSAQVAHINAHEQGKVKYVVLYRNMFGRAADHWANDFIDEYFKKREPVFTAEIAGKEFAWVYEKPVYERVLGEMLPGWQASQTVKTRGGRLAGVDILMATYSGRAVSGQVLVEIRDAGSNAVLERWERPVVEIEDNSWQNFIFDEEKKTDAVVIDVTVTGTREEDAPTIRYTRDNDYRESNLLLNGGEVPGDLAVRLRYWAGAELATEEQTRLLSDE